MRKTITFGVVEGEIDELIDTDSDRISFEKDEVDRNRVFGKYDYESKAIFGSPTTAEGTFIIDKDTNLFAIVTESDSPKPDTVFRDISDNSSVDITAPQYPAEASHDFYHTYGFGGYTTSFREDIRDYSLQSSFRYIDPDERAQERAMHDSFTTMSDDLVEEVTEELIEDGYYVASMDMALDDEITGCTFSNPLRITLPEDKDSREVIHLVCQRASELVSNEVKTVDEVLADA